MLRQAKWQRKEMIQAGDSATFGFGARLARKCMKDPPTGCFYTSGVHFVGVLVMRALSVWVDIEAPDFLEISRTDFGAVAQKVLDGDSRLKNACGHTPISEHGLMLQPCTHPALLKIRAPDLNLRSFSS